MKIAVTGASGFLGRASVASLIEKGHEVVAIGKSFSHPAEYSHPRLKMFSSDYSEESLKCAFEGVKTVLHLAARRLADSSEGLAPFYEANIHLMENVLGAAVKTGVKRFVFTSSISVYTGADGNSYQEESPMVPRTFYGLSKVVGESLGRFYSKQFPLQFTSLRFSKIFGENDPLGEQFLPMAFVSQALRRQKLFLWGRGGGGRDLLYIQDAVQALEKAMLPEAPSGVFNIGGGKAYSYLEIAEAVNEVFDNQGNIGFDQKNEEDPNSFFMDCAKAEKLLGWSRNYSLKEALEEIKRNLTQEKRSA